MADRASGRLLKLAVRRIASSQAWIVRNRPYSVAELAQVQEIRRLLKQLFEAVKVQDVKRIGELSLEIDARLVKLINDRAQRLLD